MGILRDAVEKALNYLGAAGSNGSIAYDILDLGLKADVAEEKFRTAPVPKDQPLVIGGKAIPNATVTDLVNLVTLGLIPAIKEHRTRTGFGLKESKEAIENLRNSLKDFKYVPNYKVVVDRNCLDNLLLNAGDLVEMFKPGNDHLKQAKRDAVKNGIEHVRSSRES